MAPHAELVRPRHTSRISLVFAWRLKPETVRQVLTTLVERIELDPKTLDLKIYCRLPLD